MDYYARNIAYRNIHGMSRVKTLSIHVYHPLLRRLATLATMECENETTETLTNYWVLSNEALQEISEDAASKKFNPIGMADEAGSNWSSKYLERIFFRL